MPTLKEIVRGVVVLLVTTALAVLADRFSSNRVAGFVIVVGVLVLAWMHEPWKPYFTRSTAFAFRHWVLSSLLLLLTIGFCIREWAVKGSPKSATSQQPPQQSSLIVPTIVGECAPTYLPIWIPPDSEIHLIGINREAMRSQNWGLYDVHNPTDKQQQWPTKEKLELARKNDDVSTFGYKCDFSNHGSVNVQDVSIPITFNFINDGGQSGQLEYQAILNPLDAGSHYVFYVVNDCPVVTWGTLPKSASFKIIGESDRRSVPISYPHRSVIETVMMWWPTKNPWVREQPCEKRTAQDRVSDTSANDFADAAAEYFRTLIRWADDRKAATPTIYWADLTAEQYRRSFATRCSLIFNEMVSKGAIKGSDFIGDRGPLCNMFPHTTNDLTFIQDSATKLVIIAEKMKK